METNRALHKFWLCLIAIVGIVLFIGIDWAPRRPLRAVTISQISQITKVSFPNGALPDSVNYSSASVLCAKIRLPADSIDRFLAQPLLKGKRSQSYSQLRSQPRLFPATAAEGWALAGLKHFVAVDAVVAPGSGAGVWLFLDMDGSRSKTLYLYCEN